LVAVGTGVSVGSGVFVDVRASVGYNVFVAVAGGTEVFVGGSGVLVNVGKKSVVVFVEVGVIVGYNVFVGVLVGKKVLVGVSVGTVVPICMEVSTGIVNSVLTVGPNGQGAVPAQCEPPGIQPE